MFGEPDGFEGGTSDGEVELAAVFSAPGTVVEAVDVAADAGDPKAGFLFDLAG
ncbi:Uncharacterised protein [Mycobacteroides abscessus subsp. abscessus]|nr:Uncharacterised protein [Mycobacteroides abscessus subsp. abscessus]